MCVAKALRRDGVNFFSTLLADCTEFLQPAEVKNLWRIVRRSLPFSGKIPGPQASTGPFSIGAS